MHDVDDELDDACARAPAETVVLRLKGGSQDAGDHVVSNAQGEEELDGPGRIRADTVVLPVQERVPAHFRQQRRNREDEAVQGCAVGDVLDLG